MERTWLIWGSQELSGWGEEEIRWKRQRRARSHEEFGLHPEGPGELGFEAGIGDGRFHILESSLRFWLQDGEWVGVGKNWWCPGKRNDGLDRDVTVMIGEIFQCWNRQCMEFDQMWRHEGGGAFKLTPSIRSWVSGNTLHPSERDRLVG